MDPLVDDEQQKWARAQLVASGWHEGRDVGARAEAWIASLVEDGFVPFSAASSIIKEFGGLKFTQAGPGINLAREPFDLTPVLAEGESDRFERFGDLLGRRLFPIGECGDGRFFLAVADDGQVYALADAVSLVGRTIDEALRNLLVGITDREWADRVPRLPR